MYKQGPIATLLNALGIKVFLFFFLTIS